MTEKRDETPAEVTPAAKQAKRTFLVRTKGLRATFYVGDRKITNEFTEVSEKEAGELKTAAALSGARLIIREKE